MGAVIGMGPCVLVFQDPVDPVPDLRLGDVFRERFEVAREHPNELVVLEPKRPELKPSQPTGPEPTQEGMMQGGVVFDLSFQVLEKRVPEHGLPPPHNDASRGSAKQIRPNSPEKPKNPGPRRCLDLPVFLPPSNLARSFSSGDRTASEPSPASAHRCSCRRVQLFLRTG